MEKVGFNESSGHNGLKDIGYANYKILKYILMNYDNRDCCKACFCRSNCFLETMRD